ncbi:Crp/Fnr family transcriptional regulator [Maribacter antarcticus]|uniref:Crp/Fnr family transcriptional regulator n=1 Tax=Maribacter antarcticus TaxID=505250 RepID=UPI000A0550AC|nr:Crp/Fnr family transcriptional regulator [Maribacter antarcticus]
MNEFRNQITNSINLKKENLDLLENHVEKTDYQKNDLLIQPGKVCSFIALVNNGIFRSYIIKNGTEFNIDFYMPKTYMSSYTSFITQTPTKGYIQALSNSTVYYLSSSNYQKLLNTDSEFYKLSKLISETLFIRKCKRETTLLMDTARERYEFLLKNYPNIEQLIPQYQIASYLGIKPESLSRLKKLT